MGLDSQFSTVGGFCICCGDNAKVMAPSRRPFLSTPAEIGVCDLCAYALGHAWRRELGQLVRATSPRVSRTYLLVPRLPSGKNETDLASYQFLVTADGGLPHVDFAVSGKYVAHLKATYGVVAWEPMWRPCYLGYAASGDFSEVVLARAWGRVPGTFIKARFATFGELLGKPTPDAGFYLGVKAAFEGLLWRLEQAQEDLQPEGPQPEGPQPEGLQPEGLQPEGGAFCTVMRESAMRYLAARLAGKREEGDGDDPAMVEMFRTMMTADELEVVRLVEEASKRPPVAAPATGKKEPEKVDETPTDVSGFFEGAEEEATVDDATGDVPEGFARPARTMP